MSFDMPSSVRIEGPYGRGRPPAPPRLTLNDFATIEIIDSGGGYDWTEGRLLRLKDTDELYFVVESGCSCNSYEDAFGETYEGMQTYRVANWQEAVEKAKEVAQDSYNWTDDTVVEFANRLMKGMKA